MNVWYLPLGPAVRALAGVAVAAALGAGCGSGAGSGLPCELDTDCVPGEVCLRLSCEATGKTCQVLCEIDTDCTGGLDSSPSGAMCLPADTSTCPVDGQDPSARYCAQ